jgi:hypothetical protein
MLLQCNCKMLFQALNILALIIFALLQDFAEAKGGRGEEEEEEEEEGSGSVIFSIK